MALAVAGLDRQRIEERVKRLAGGDWGSFTAAERVELIRRVSDPLGNVVVKQFAGLAVRFVRECNARVIIRGVRSLSDMEAEFTMTLANRKLDPGIETVFLMASERSQFISSRFVKEIYKLGGDVGQFVSPRVVEALKGK
jgi:pantetheine-phosphate adenylyltransferase